MDREERLKFCSVCNHKKFTMQEGVICGLTGLSADFEEHCESYDEDPRLKTMQTNRAEKAHFDDYQAVSKGKRFANFALDMIFITVANFFISIPVMIFFPPELDFLGRPVTSIGTYIQAIVVGVLYYTILEGASGKSIAKYVTKTKVVNLEGEKPSFGAVFIRSLCRYIPFDGLSFLGSEATGWHDTLSKTRVVNEEFAD